MVEEQEYICPGKFLIQDWTWGARNKAVGMCIDRLDLWNWTSRDNLYKNRRDIEQDIKLRRRVSFPTWGKIYIFLNMARDHSGGLEKIFNVSIGSLPPHPLKVLKWATLT